MSTLDQTRVDEFSHRMLEVLNNGFLAMMTSIGHQTGLFDTLAALPPSTSSEVARAGGLNERYVREWLGAMVTGRIVDYDPRQRTYRLPPEHAASLTHAAGSGNIATVMQYIACMGSVGPGIVECFRKGGGLQYSAYERFHRIMVEQTGQVFDETLIERTLPLVPGLVERVTAGIAVLDVGCGSDHAVNVMARAFPKNRFTGYGFSSEGIAAARAEARTWGLTNAVFEVQDVTSLRERGVFDLITTLRFTIRRNPRGPCTRSPAPCATTEPTSWWTSPRRASSRVTLTPTRRIGHAVRDRDGERSR